MATFFCFFFLSSSYDLLLPEEDPLHTDRRATLQRLTSNDAKSARALAPLATRLEQTMRTLTEIAQKREWLRALLLANEFSPNSSGGYGPDVGGGDDDA